MVRSGALSITYQFRCYLLVGLILARLLTPAEYGIMAMIAIFIAVSNSIVDSGFSNALIRKVRIER